MSNANPINRLTAMEAVFLSRLHNLQAKQDNGVSADMLPYTEQVKWIVGEMTKKFPKRRWTEKLVSRTLVRMRKASLLDKTEQSESKVDVPKFHVDDDVEMHAEIEVIPVASVSNNGTEDSDDSGQ